MNPYDELPYWAFPIECTAPERLAAVSLLNGGPRLDAGSCRMLEIGCANGANLLPLAWYRRGCQFVGLDHSAEQVAQAEADRQALQLNNLAFD